MTSVAKMEKSKMKEHNVTCDKVDPSVNDNPQVFTVIPGIIQNMDVVDKTKCNVKGT